MFPWRPGDQDMIARQMAEQAVAASAAMQQAMSAVIPSYGTADVPALALGATTQVVVAINPPIPDAAYTPIPVLYGTPLLLGSLTLAGIIAKSETSVTVQVRAPLAAVTAGAVLHVVAFRINEGAA